MMRHGSRAEVGRRGVDGAGAGVAPADLHLGHGASVSGAGAGAWARSWRRSGWAILALLALVMLTCALAPLPLAAQQASIDSGRVVARLQVSDDVRTTWRRVTACATEHRDTTKTLDQVVFLLRTPGTRGPTGKLLKGEYVPPDTIYVTQGYEHSGWIIAHELLHHALGGPPAKRYGTAHPYVPFAFPCGLWDDPTSDVGEFASEGQPANIGGPSFAYPVLGFAVYIQGTLLAGHGWWRA